MDSDMPDHPKTIDLAAILDIPQAHAAGLMGCLWGWALKYACDGKLERFSNAVIAKGAKWHMDPDEYVAALTQVGYLDEDKAIHDWWKHAGKTVLLSEKDRLRARTSRARKADVPGTSAVTDKTDNTNKETRKTAIEAYEDAVARPITPSEVDTLRSWLEDYAEDWIVEAIKEAVNNNVRKLSYIGRILENWKEKGKGSGRSKAKDQTVAVAPKDCTGCDLVGQCNECPREKK
jgi:DnaD/phage-associated family protein